MDERGVPGNAYPVLSSPQVADIRAPRLVRQGGPCEPAATPCRWSATPSDPAAEPSGGCCPVDTACR